MNDNNNEKENYHDALGQLLWDYFYHKDGLRIIERNDEFIEPEEPQVYFNKYNEWLDVEKKAIEYVKGKRVLDICCGVGRRALYLQRNRKKDFDVFGIDTSPLAIRICDL